PFGRGRANFAENAFFCSRDFFHVGHQELLFQVTGTGRSATARPLDSRRVKRHHRRRSWPCESSSIQSTIPRQRRSSSRRAACRSHSSATATVLLHLRRSRRSCRSRAACTPPVERDRNRLW